MREIIVVRRKSSFLAALAVGLFALGLVASSASATFHLIKVREVSSGTGTPDSSYIEVQMYAPFQNFLHNGAELAVCDSTCSSASTIAPFPDVANGDSQDTVLFGDTGIASGSKDFDVDLNLNSIEAGGAACYVSEPGFTDCVSWGSFIANSVLTGEFGTSANPGSPAPALSSGMALRRSIAPGCPTLLESSDDTNNSAADFSLTTPNPRKNSVAPTEVMCPPSSGAGAPTATPTTVPHKKKKCKKHKRRSAQRAKKKCKKKRK